MRPPSARRGRPDFPAIPRRKPAQAWRPSSALHRTLRTAVSSGRRLDFLAAAPGADFVIGDEFELLKGERHVRGLQARNTFEKRAPASRVVEPAFPQDIEALFDRVGQPPKRNRAGQIKNLRASCGGNHANGAGLGKVVRSRESTAQYRRPLRPELPIRIPPPSKIHFANARDDGADLQQPLEIQAPIRHAALALRARHCDPPAQLFFFCAARRSSHCFAGSSRVICKYIPISIGTGVQL